jgi:hypothetical protein
MRKRLSLIGRKKFRTPIVAESSMHILVENDNEALVLFKNKCDFGLTGSGSFIVLHGIVRIMGYDINAEMDKNEYPFYINSEFDVYSSQSFGVRGVDIEKNVARIVKTTGSKNINLASYFECNDFISVVYFKGLNEFKIFDDIKGIIDFSKYEKSVAHVCDYNSFSISGKKNSGKSTFLVYLLNNLLSNREDNHALYLLDCDTQPLLSMPYCISLVKVTKPLFHNTYLEIVPTQIIRSIFVEDISHIKCIDKYINSFKNLFRLYNSQTTPSTLIINTNGDITGMGGLISTSLLEVSKPQINFYIKNIKKGRLEKGAEFENYITKDIEIQGLDIIIRKYKKQHLDEIKNTTRNKRTNLDTQCLEVINSFEVKDAHNTFQKNKLKSLYTLVNLFGYKTPNTNFTFNDILYNHRLNIINLDKYLCSIPFEDIIFSLNNGIVTLN